MSGYHLIMLKKLLMASLAILGVGSMTTLVRTSYADNAPQTSPTPLQFTMKLLDGQEKDLSTYQGKVVLIVNTASHCGFARQFTSLEQLHQKYESQGLVVLGFPSNDFNQEEDTSEGISKVCHEKYGVTFEMFSPIHVKGDQIHPLYAYLTSPEHNKVNASPVAWNFEKFLISRDGTIVAHHPRNVEPDSKDFINEIEAELAK